MIFEPGPYITPRHLPIRLEEPSDVAAEVGAHPKENDDLSLEQAERMLLLKALKRSAGNKSEAARILGVTRDTLRYKLQKWQIEAREDQDDIG